jgi:hypothetical protein
MTAAMVLLAIPLCIAIEVDRSTASRAVTHPTNSAASGGGAAAPPLQAAAVALLLSLLLSLLLLLLGLQHRNPLSRATSLKRSFSIDSREPAHEALIPAPPNCDPLRLVLLLATVLRPTGLEVAPAASAARASA